MAVAKKGPVHINVPFEEPLYERVNAIAVDTKMIDFASENNTLENLDIFVNQWNQARKKLILIGGCNPNYLQQTVVDFLANEKSVVVMTEATSNVHNANFITNIDAIITPFTEENFINFQPEILITIGGMIVSKRIKALLRKYKPQQHWHIDELRAYDTFYCLTKHFEVSPNVFFNEFIPKTIPTESDYLQKALDIKKIRTQKTETYLATIPFSDFKAFEIILPKLALHSQLQISNSSSIRYAQLFPIHSSIEVFCNRGTSGIDGSTSTAIGAALASGKETVLITGDISFLYDSNAMWNNYIPENFKIILLNNGGGGIFRILPGHEENETFNTFFETSHQYTAAHLAKMYNFEYEQAVDEKLLKEKLEILLMTKKSIILEVFTPTKVNNSILLNYFNNLT